MDEVAHKTEGRKTLSTLACPACGRPALCDCLKAPDRYHSRTVLYRLMRCDSCALISLAYPPSPQEMSAHYGDDYYEGIAAAGEATKRWQKQREVIGRYKQHGNVLDIGCSSGGFLRTFKDSGSWKLHGIEIASAMAERARLNTGAEVFVGDALSAPFVPATFDVITCFDVLEHVHDPQGLLRKVLEWLKPGGLFYTMLPNIDSWEASLFGSYWYGLELPRHLFHFSPRSLRHTMELVGLREGSIETKPVSYIEYSARYLCGNILAKIGLSVRPLVKARRPGIPWRIVRKMLRLSVVAPFGQLAALAGAGANMEAIFFKPIQLQTDDPATLDRR